jgi:hypothetical protein
MSCGTSLRSPSSAYSIEVKLVEGALTTAGHAIGILKSYTPNLDLH